MKNRILPSGLLAIFMGLSLLFVPGLTMSGHPGNTEGKKFDGKSRIEKIRANQLTGTVNANSLMEAQNQIQKMQSDSKGTQTLNWISMGPDNYAGVTWSLLFDNKDATSNTIYAGSVNGGIWRSTNLGLTWHQMNAESNNIPKVSSLVQTSTGRIYASTGLTYCRTAPYAGTGLYYSDDGYTFVHAPNTSGHNFYSVAKLCIDPRNDRIFAATNSGLHYSDDGVEWFQVREGYCNDVVIGSDGTILTQVNDISWIAREGNVDNFIRISTDLPNGLPTINGGWTVFAIAPSDPNVMYASVADTTGNLYNIYLSSDKGTNWSVIFPGNDTFEPFDGQGCYANTITVFPSDPYQVLLGGVDLWWGRKIQETGYYDWGVMSYHNISPLSTLYVPANHHQYLFRTGFPTQFALANDGGVSTAIIGPDYIQFKNVNKNYSVSRFNSVAMSRYPSWVIGGGDAIGTQVIGAYYPAVVNNPTDGYQVWWDGTGGADQGGTGGACAWSTISPLTVFFEKTGDSIRREELSDPSYTNGFVMGIVNNKVDVTPIQFWESFDFEYTRDSTTYINNTGKEIVADTAIIVKSKTVEFPFIYTTKDPIPAGDSIRIPDPVASRFFVAGTRSANNSVWMTKGALNYTEPPTWFKILLIPSTDTVYTKDLISTMAISKDLNTMWVGTEGGRMIRISNIALAYNYATADVSSPTCIIADEYFPNLPFLGRFISSISINPNDSRQVMVTLGNYDNTHYVYMTQNGNDSLPVFTSVQGNLPSIPVFSGLIEMHDNNRAIIGTEYGIFATSNLTGGSPEWNLELTNMGDVPVTEIKQQTLNHFLIENMGTIYASTYGRGIFIDTTYYTPVGIDPNTVPVNNNSGMLRISPNPVKDMVNITYNLDKAGWVDIHVTDIMGRNVLSQSLGDKSKGTNVSSLDMSSLPAGTYIVRIANSYGKIVKL